MYFYKFKISNIDKDKEKIKEIVKNIYPENKTNCAYKSTERGLQYNLNLYVNDLSEIIFCIKKCIKDCMGLSVDLQSIWTVIGKYGTYHTIHRHSENTNKISTVLYLEVPTYQINSEGAIYFIDDKYANYNTCVKIIKPESGDLIIFPSSIFHGTYPQGHGTRHTLNMDFLITEP